jgi:hypothetical protein
MGGTCITHTSLHNYCDMTPERWKRAVREAPQKCPLLDNGTPGTSPQQRVSPLKPDRCYEINTRSRVNVQITNALHGYLKLYTVCRRTEKNGFIRN